MAQSHAISKQSSWRGPTLLWNQLSVCSASAAAGAFIELSRCGACEAGMKWTDEVHIQRTIEARKEARLVGRGGEPQGKGHAHLAALVAASGALASLAFVEKEGLPPIRDIPVVGGWLSEQIARLRAWQRKMNPRRRRAGGRPQLRGPPSEQARAAAIRRAEAKPPAGPDSGRPPRPQTPVSQPQASSSQSQPGGSRPNKKKKKHRK